MNILVAKSDYQFRHASLSVCPHGTTQFPLDVFSWNLIFDCFSKICREIRVSLKSDKYKFKVCKSVHHRTIQINHKPDATVFQFIILTFIYSSTCFGRSPAHHQELNDCSGSLWFYLRIVVIAVLCSWSGRPAGPTTNRARVKLSTALNQANKIGCSTESLKTHREFNHKTL